MYFTIHILQYTQERPSAAVEVQGDYSGHTGLEQVARVMGLGRSFSGSEREVFMVGIQSFDSHSGEALTEKLGMLNRDLTAFHTDMNALSLWDATTVISISDFGRTITTNGRGTDHAWSGNTFIVGGSVKGGHIHGQYPDDLNPATSEFEVGGGRGVFIPTTPWYVAVLRSALHRVALLCTALHCVALRCTALRCTAQRCAALRCAALRCTALRCAALRCAGLRCPGIPAENLFLKK